MREFQGPCTCGDPCCPSCGDPAAEEAAEAEVQRVIQAVGEDYGGAVRCSCGKELKGADGECFIPTVTVANACVACFYRLRPPEPEPELDFGRCIWCGSADITPLIDEDRPEDRFCRKCKRCWTQPKETNVEETVDQVDLDSAARELVEAWHNHLDAKQQLDAAGQRLWAFFEIGTPYKLPVVVGDQLIDFRNGDYVVEKVRVIPPCV